MGSGMISGNCKESRGSHAGGIFASRQQVQARTPIWVARNLPGWQVPYQAPNAMNHGVLRYPLQRTLQITGFGAGKKSANLASSLPPPA
jgi:hypothetical protein